MYNRAGTPAGVVRPLYTETPASDKSGTRRGDYEENGQTVRHELRITIHRPVKEVFPYVSQPDKLVMWQHRIANVSTDVQGSLQKGAELQLVLRDGLGASRDVRMRINDYARNERLEYELKGPGFILDGRYIFEEDGDQTYVIYTTVRHAKGLKHALLAPYLKLAIGHQLKSDLHRLKEVVEAG